MFQSCEGLRVALESLEPEKDMENFVRDYGTGSQIPAAPAFIDYAAQDPRPAATKPRYANFARSTQRPISAIMGPTRGYDEEPEPEPVGPGNAGVGAGGVAGRGIDDRPPPTRKQSQRRVGGRSMSMSSSGGVGGNEAPPPPAAPAAPPPTMP